jgi:hypothetical protein
MWRGLLAFAFILVFNIASRAQSNIRNLTLKDFRKGIYAYENGRYRGGKVTRTKKWQVEEYPDLNLKIKFRIDWIADFEYHLTCVQVNDPVSDCFVGQVIKVKVLSVKDDMFSVLVQNGRHLETINMRMLDDDPKDQENYYAVINNFKVSN